MKRPSVLHVLLLLSLVPTCAVSSQPETRIRIRVVVLNAFDEAKREPGVAVWVMGGDGSELAKGTTDGKGRVDLSWSQKTVKPRVIAVDMGTWMTGLPWQGANRTYTIKSPCTLIVD